MAQLAMSSPPEQGLPRHRAGEPSPVAAHARDATTRAIAPAATASSSTTPAAIAPPTVATAAANQTPATVLGPPHRAPPKKHAPPPYRHWIRPWPHWIHALHLLPPSKPRLQRPLMVGQSRPTRHLRGRGRSHAATFTTCRASCWQPVQAATQREGPGGRGSGSGSHPRRLRRERTQA